jgi:putative acetyltransferase
MIQKMDASQRYEILDLWLRCTAAANPFFESNFWQKNYEDVKAKYLTDCENYVYIEGTCVVAFICISNSGYVNGLFVDPDYRGNGIGKQLVKYVKTCYDVLRMNIYAKSRKMLDFASKEGFLIDGALYQEESGQVKYTLVWQKDNGEDEY